MKKNLLLTTIAITTFSLLALPSRAQIIEYTNLAAFTAAVGGSVTTNNYDGIESNPNGAVLIHGPTSIGSVTVDASGTPSTVNYVYGANVTPQPGDGSSVLVPYNDTEEFALPTGTASGLGVTFFSVQNEAENIAGFATASNGDTLAFSGVAPLASGTPSSVAFIGFSDLAPGISIDSITFTSGPGVGVANVGFGNVSFGGTVAPVSTPEPTVAALLLSGLGLLMIIMRRKSVVA